MIQWNANTTNPPQKIDGGTDWLNKYIAGAGFENRQHWLPTPEMTYSDTKTFTMIFAIEPNLANTNWAAGGYLFNIYDASGLAKITLYLYRYDDATFGLHNMWEIGLYGDDGVQYKPGDRYIHEHDLYQNAGWSTANNIAYCAGSNNTKQFVCFRFDGAGTGDFTMFINDVQNYYTSSTVCAGAADWTGMDTTILQNFSLNSQYGWKGKLGALGGMARRCFK